jgi:hypothetical protein
LQHPDLDFAGVTILGNSPDDLDGYSRVGVSIDGLDDFAKGPLAQQSDRTIWAMRDGFSDPKIEEDEEKDDSQRL